MNNNRQNANEKFQLQKALAAQRHHPTLLLHVCCAPCATQCLMRLLDVFDVTLFYSNDNITDKTEWQKRLSEVQKLVEIVNGGKYETPARYPLKLVMSPFQNQRFFAVAKGFEEEKEGGARCEKCFLLRLSDAADYAKWNNFDYFCTTLSISPYKNSNLLNTIGESLQSDGTRWLFADFKKNNGYNESLRLCQKYNLYRQHYCGCVFSQRSCEKGKSDQE